MHLETIRIRYIAFPAGEQYSYFYYNYYSIYSALTAHINALLRLILSEQRQLGECDCDPLHKNPL